MIKSAIWQSNSVFQNALFEILSLTEPIYTRTGRYSGGVYVVEGYNICNLYLRENEITLLHKLCMIVESQSKCILDFEEIKLLKHMITTYSKFP